MSLANLKKNRAAVLDKLKKASETQASGGGAARQVDERMWRPTFDKERGVGSAVIRFMPAVEGEDLPWAKVIKHAFKGPTGKWYIENSLRTIGKSDPVAILNAKLWNSGVDSDKEIAKAQKQKIEYFANVLVIKDPANPENEGKVKIYRFGPMIFEMIQEKMFPKFEDDAPMNPFDPWEGANFNIKMVAKTVGKDVVPNYEKSTFGEPAVMCMGDEDEIERVYGECHKLAEFTAESNFKTEDELKRKLFDVLGPTVGSGIETVEGLAAPKAQETRQAAPRQERVIREDSSDIPFDTTPQASGSSDDDDLEFLKQLVKDM